MFITYKGSSPTNPLQGSNTGHLILACPSVPDALVLHLFQESTPYDRRRQGWQQQDGRSSTGSNRIKGDRYPFKPTIMQASFLVSLPQAVLFEDLLLAQEAGGFITVQDWFGAGDAALYWVQPDDNYLTVEPSLPLDWRRLQFIAGQEV